MTDAERQAALDAIGAEVAICTRCRLHQTRTKSVPGEGTAATEVLFVGEGPGFNEDQQGRPFVGRAGDFLGKMLSSIYWKREEVFITNVVKCRPPENRDPEPDEIAACAPYLTRQIEALDPALVVTLGRFSMARFNPGARIGQVHGTLRAAHEDAGAPRALVYFMYHPAAALRDPAVAAVSLKDMEGVPQALLDARKLRGAIAEPAEAAEPPSPASPAEPDAPAAPDAPVPAGEPVPSPSPARTSQSVQPANEDRIVAETDPTDQLGLF